MKATLNSNLSGSLNLRAKKLCEELSDFHIKCGSGADIYDLKKSGLLAGKLMARICMADLANVALVPRPDLGGINVVVDTDEPLKACMASQYAGWPVNVEKYFAMGSGPMRSVRGKEKVIESYELGENCSKVVGVLETSKLPSAEVCQAIASECKTDTSNVSLIVAPTASIAGTVQIVARSVETAIHKLDELKFDLRNLVSGFGSAPLPPIAKSDLAAIGLTNDSILYGGEVSLWVNCDDEEIEKIGEQVPSNSSKDHGRSFASIFESYDRDFYKIDPMLFSPAMITFFNTRTGKSFRFGELSLEILNESFAL